MSPDPNFDLIAAPEATPAPALVQLTLAAAPRQVEPAGVVTYTVVITNTLADRALSGLVVSDTLPLELAYWPAGEGEFSYLEAERRLEWAIGQLAAGATLTGTFQAQALAEVSGQVITNTAASGRSEAGAHAGPARPGLWRPHGHEQRPAWVRTVRRRRRPHRRMPPPTATPTAEAPPCLGFECTPTPTATPSLCQDDEGCTPTPTATWTPTATPGPDEVWLTPGEGGVLLSADGRVQVEARPGAVSAPTLLRYTPQPLVGETPAWLTMHFGLEAQDEQGAAVTAFESLVSLTYRFPPSVALTETIRLYRWEDAAETWQALDSQMDVAGRQLTAWLDGPGLFGLGAPASLSYGAQHLPTVHGFVTDEWSGNSSLGYPLALPPGPGGLGLNLSLGYSSEGVNSIRQGASSYDITPTASPTATPGNTPTPTATAQHVNQDEHNAKTFSRQAGFVGWGWSLNGLGQVTMSLAQDGTPAKAFLGYAGGGFELKQTTDGWQTEPQSFVRIAHAGNLDSGNKWEVWSPDGVKYTFGGVTGSNATWANGSAWIIKSSCGKSAREMHLTEVLDTHGNHIEITYETEPGSVTGCTDEYVPAIRPTVIRYFAINEPLATVRIELGYQSRDDVHVEGWDSPNLELFFSTYRLQTITVLVRSSTSAFATVRSYVLTQDYDWFDSNYHDNKAIMRLTSITEQGRDGGALPAWTFGYRIGAVGTQGTWKNHTLLETANNGQGGGVTYSYENHNNIGIGLCGENTSRYSVSQMLVEDGLGTATHNKVETLMPPATIFLGQRQRHAPACHDNFEFGGYGFVRKAVKDGADAAPGGGEQLSPMRHDLAAVACGSGNELGSRKGKVYQQVTKSSAGTTLAQVGTLWNSVTTKVPTGCAAKS
ncbi:hypothetical protein [Candidatus Amarolinea dominans]|uniref:hypothetical protein n=1 Tax=Candidatus Amarolinea dominans TaxID=3140696 RepID=UPI0031346813|nr:DUF11 domain-containing protein [Anaerolineae bacterium]